MDNRRVTAVRIFLLSMGFVFISMLTVTSTWATDVTLRLVDQDGNLIPASKLVVNPGAIVVLQNSAVALAPGDYTITIHPGINAVEQTAYLSRNESVTVSGGAQIFEFAWQMADLTVDVVDQNAVAIPASQWAIVCGSNISGGSTLHLPVTKDSVEPVTGGSQSDGYDIYVLPGINGVSQSSFLNRMEVAELDHAGIVVNYVWPMANLTVDVVDQTAVAIPASQWAIVCGSNISGGSTLHLPVTGDPAEPVTGGSQSDGYDIYVLPGINGVSQSSFLNRMEVAELDHAGLVVNYVWPMADLTVDVVDQNAVAIPASQWEIVCSSTILGGSTLHLPVTEDPAEPLVGGSQSEGYHVHLFPGINGVLQEGGLLFRTGVAELGSGDLDVNYVWPMAIGTLHVVDNSESEVVGASFYINPWGRFGTFATGDSVNLPVTEDMSAPAIDGLYATGYQIAIKLPDSTIFAGPFVFELAPIAAFTPLFVDIGGGNYGMRYNLDQTVFTFIEFFEARLIDEGVELVWAIASDDDIEGFKIYREEADQHKITRVNDSELISSGSRLFVDRDVRLGDTYVYTLAVVTSDGLELASPPIRVSLAAGIDQLLQNHPNPFNPSTMIEYVLAEPAVITLVIYDVEGRRIATIDNGPRGAGRQVAVWNGRDDNGTRVASGVYFYRLTADNRTLTKRMILLK